MVMPWSSAACDTIPAAFRRTYVSSRSSTVPNSNAVWCIPVRSSFSGSSESRGEHSSPIRWFASSFVSQAPPSNLCMTRKPATVEYQSIISSSRQVFRLKWCKLGAGTGSAIGSSLQSFDSGRGSESCRLRAGAGDRGCCAFARPPEQTPDPPRRDPDYRDQEQPRDQGAPVLVVL